MNEFQKKTTQKLFQSDRITKKRLVDTLYLAYHAARAGKRGSMDEIKFEYSLAINIDNLANSILDRSYRPSRSIAFMISSPVTREIFAAPFRDRVVHHFLYMLCAEWWDRRFIGNSFSCRVGKGTLYGRRQMQKAMRKCSKMGKIPSVVQKFDLSGYFMSLDRGLLYERITWGLKQQFENAPRLRALVGFLWKQVIFDNPVRNVTVRGLPNDWKKIARSKTLITQPEGVGIVIGNLTSQLLSNIYLDQLDRYICFKLGYEYYGRYVDDFAIVTTEEDRPQLLKDVKNIRLFLRSIGLELHPDKCYGQPVEHGVEFLGSVVYLKHFQPGKRLKKNFSRAVHTAVKFPTPKNQEILTSYEGIFSHLQCSKWKEKVFERLGEPEF